VPNSNQPSRVGRRGLHLDTSTRNFGPAWASSTFVEIQHEDPSENYAPTLGWSLRLFLGGSLFLDDEQIIFIDDFYL
jgi:hypothetical protein